MFSACQLSRAIRSKPVRAELADDVADDADQRRRAQRRRAGEALAAARERLGAVAERLRRRDDDVHVPRDAERQLDRAAGGRR